MGALARDRLADGRQLTQGAFLGHEFKNDRPVLTFCAQPGDAGGDNAPVIKSPRPPQAPTRAFSASLRFGDKSRLIEQFIALQNQIGHPWEVLEAKIIIAALAARLAGFSIGFDPRGERRSKFYVLDRGGESPFLPCVYIVPRASEHTL